MLRDLQSRRWNISVVVNAKERCSFWQRSFGQAAGVGYGMLRFHF